MTNSSSSSLPSPPCIVDERTPCLAGEGVDSNTELTSTVANEHEIRKSKRFAIAWAAMAILLILSACSSGATANSNTTTNTSNGFSITWESQRQQQLMESRQHQNPPSSEEYLSFDDFVVKFDKSYESNQDYEYRKGIYEANLQDIQAHNEKDHGWTMGINQFADLLPQEIHKGLDKSGLSSSGSVGRSNQVDAQQESNHLPFASLLDKPNHLRTSQEKQSRRNLLLEDLPDFVDWRLHDPPVTTPVKDQGHCGSCWAFAATAVLESHAALATQELFSLSPQELVSCAPNPNHCGGDGGCTGSTGELAYDYVSKKGMVTEWEYGYTSYHGDSGTCRLREWKFARGGVLATGFLVGAKVGLVGYSSLPTNSYEALMQAVATLGPVVVSVAASGWAFYKGGVFDDYDLTEHYDINHAVVLEGYGTDPDTQEDYWLVRNSWGVQWGEDGYIRLKRNVTHEEDRCKLDVTPSHGVACEGPDQNATIPDQTVCGTSGILYANVVPVGAYLIQDWL